MTIRRYITANKVKQVNARNMILTGIDIKGNDVSANDKKRMWRLFTDAILDAYANGTISSADVYMEYDKCEVDGNTRFTLVSIMNLDGSYIWLH